MISNKVSISLVVTLSIFLWAETALSQDDGVTLKDEKEDIPLISLGSQIGFPLLGFTLGVNIDEKNSVQFGYYPAKLHFIEVSFAGIRGIHRYSGRCGENNAYYTYGLNRNFKAWKMAFIPSIGMGWEWFLSPKHVSFYLDLNLSVVLGEDGDTYLIPCPGVGLQFSF